MMMKEDKRLKKRGEAALFVALFMVSGHEGTKNKKKAKEGGLLVTCQAREK